MRNSIKLLTYIVLLPFLSGPNHAQDKDNMSFFITSKGVGNGGNLGGLQGADQHCQTLATAVGAGGKTWRAYLSTTADPAPSDTETGAHAGHHERGIMIWNTSSEKNTSQALPPVNARDRIGTGPWYNAKGIMIAKNIDELHSDRNNLNKETALNESGEVINGVGDRPNFHDILTGSMTDGNSAPGRQETTCRNWTNNRPGSSALVGHHDRTAGDYRVGSGDIPTSWNSAHYTSGCSQSEFEKTGGIGLFYCFATD
jgi:hypothetical protein